jgi:putative transposase
VLDHLIVVNEAHLRAVLREYAAYYNAHRPHRGLQLEPPLRPRRDTPIGTAAIRARPVLGGLHHTYDRAA